MAELTDRELLIKLGEKVDSLIENFKTIAPLEERVRCVERENYGVKNDISNIKKDVTDLETKSEKWSILNSVGIALVGIVSLLIQLVGK